MPKNIFLQINSSGCLTSCQHCWAQSKPFKHMPLSDVEDVLFKMKEYLADKPEYTLDPFPMFEELAHPETVAQMKLFIKYGMVPYEMPTSGIALANRPDWKEILDCIKELEYKFMVLSFHGIGATHDKSVNRKDAFEDIKLALTRIRSAGIDLSVNVFITKENADEIPELINKVIVPDKVHVNILISFARYNSTSRGRKYEQIRAEYSDMERISSTLAEYCGDGETAPDKEQFLSEIKANTEAELVKLALSLSNEERKNYKPRFMDDIWLVADQNFDLYTGKGNYLTIHHGNIRKDNLSDLMKKALTDNPFSALHSCFSRDISDIDIAELAAEYGDPEGQKIYKGGLNEIKDRWIDQAFAEYRRY